MPLLTRHPDFASEPDVRIEAEAMRSGTALTLRYRLSGLDGVALPIPAISERTDELWRHTCFEAFVGAGDEGYVEINLAPSTQWAAYRFDGYRQGMRNAEIAAPRIRERREGDALVLEAELDLPVAGVWRVGLAAVVEAADGSLSWWALAHPPGKPDFHHADCFALELPESRGP